MGYWYYFATVDKDVVAKVRDMRSDALLKHSKSFFPAIDIETDSKGNSWISFHDLLQGLDAKVVHSFGNCYDNAENFCKLGSPMFSSESTSSMFEEYSPYVVGKEAMLDSIKFYRQKTLAYFQGLLLTKEEMVEAYGRGDFSYYNKKNKTREERLVEDIKSKISEWTNFPPYSLNTATDVVVDSTLYEYVTFELVRLYKTIDWEKQCVIFYGS